MKKTEYVAEESRGISWSFSIIFAVIAFGAGYVLGIRGINPPQSETAADELDSSRLDEKSTLTEKYSLEVADQNPGLSVVIQNVHMTVAGWVTIRENLDGEPGKILGAQMFNPEDTSGEVTLLRSTLPGNTYFAELRSDNGDRMFSVIDDAPLSSSLGTVRASFVTPEKSAPPRNDLSQ